MILKSNVAIVTLVEKNMCNFLEVRSQKSEVRSQKDFSQLDMGVQLVVAAGLTQKTVNNQ